MQPPDQRSHHCDGAGQDSLNPSSPLPYSHIVSASIPRMQAGSPVFVKDLCDPSCLLKLLCIFARFPERCDICSFRLSPCPYWIVSSRPRRESRTKLFSSPKICTKLHSHLTSASAIPHWNRNSNYQISCKSKKSRHPVISPYKTIMISEVNVAMAIGEMVCA